MGKKTVYTKITPLPPNVPRQLAVDMLHSHTEVIQLNPLVTGVRPIEAPRDAASDEFFSSWYEITEIITWGFGLKKKISFKGVFHDQPWGLQTHVYAPMGVDMRNKYRIGGNQPGEPRETKELGLDIPTDGLYLREDVEITCAVPMTTSFVKKEAKAATGIMVDRLTRKAELLDEGKLHAMFENGRLKTIKPSLYPTYGENHMPSPLASPSSPTSPSNPRASFASSFGTSSAVSTKPVTDEQGYTRYSDLIQQSVSQPHAPPAGSQVFEVAGSTHHPAPTDSLYPLPLQPHHRPPAQQFVAELPGDIGPPHSPSPSSPRPISIHHDTATQQQYISYRPSYEGGSSSTMYHDEKPILKAEHPATRSSPPAVPPRATSPDSPSRVSQCPMCDDFMGDSAAVTHHVETSHPT